MSWLEYIAKILFCLALAIGLSLVPSAVSTYAQKSTKAEAPKNPLLGRWKSDEAVIEFRTDGSITINGEEYTYKVKNSVITVSGGEGSLAFPFEMDGDTLTVDAQGREVVYTRLKGKANADQGTATGTGTGTGEGIMSALVGKWCYMSNLTGSNS